MTSTSPAARWDIIIELGADFVQEFYLPGDYHSATGYMHVRADRTLTIIVSGTVTFGAYDSGNDRTLMTLTITDTATSALTRQTAEYDVLVVLAGVSEFFLAGQAELVPRMSQPGVP